MAAGRRQRAAGTAAGISTSEAQQQTGSREVYRICAFARRRHLKIAIIGRMEYNERKGIR